MKIVPVPADWTVRIVVCPTVVQPLSTIGDRSGSEKYELLHVERRHLHFQVELLDCLSSTSVATLLDSVSRTEGVTCLRSLYYQSQFEFQRP